MKLHRIALCCSLLVFAGCELQSNEDFWTAEVCTERLEADVVDFQEYQENFKKNMEAMELAARRGNTTDAETIKKNAESSITATKSLLAFIDKDIIPLCKNKVSGTLLSQIEQARQWAMSTTIDSFEDEDMPDLRVTKMESTFIPYELNEYGDCYGPFIDLKITIANMGAGDFPRPVDIEYFAQRAQRKPEELVFLTVSGILDYENEQGQGARVDVELTGASGAYLKKGASLTVSKRIKIDHNQTHAKATGMVTGNAFLKTGSGAKAIYETKLDIPIWDIYTTSHLAIAKTEKKKQYVQALGTITNNGPTPTPGPVNASFIMRDKDGRQLTSWNGTTTGPVSGEMKILSEKIPFDGKLPPDMTVDSSIIPLCPNGEAGGLADGNTKDNFRTLTPKDGGNVVPTPDSSAGSFNLDDY